MKPEEKAHDMLRLLGQVDSAGGTVSLELRAKIRLLVVEFEDKNAEKVVPGLVYSRDGKWKGRTTGGTRYCGVDGCKGPQIGVRWHDKRITWPCLQGMFERPDGQLQIGQPVESHA
jgi:hypothetical protein